MGTPKFILSLVVTALMVTSVAAPQAARADAGGSGAAVCAASPMNIGVTDNEKKALYNFGVRLNAIRNYRGKAGFEARLQAVLATAYPDSITLSKVSPTFLQRLINRIDQERVYDVIASSIGLRNSKWLKFEYHMRNISLFGVSQGSPFNQFSTVEQELVKEILLLRRKAPASQRSYYNSAFIAITDIYIQMQALRVLNSEQLYANFPTISDDFSTNIKTAATLGVAAVGATITVGTLVYGGAIVAGGGAVAGVFGGAGASILSSATGYAFSSAVWAARAIRIGQIAGGATVGLVGAPAVAAIEDSYHTVTEAIRLSRANHTSYECELRAQFAHQWQNFGSHSVRAAAYGVGFGTAGGVITTLGPKAASALLTTAWYSVLTAQGYALVNMGIKTRESVIYYQWAKEAAEDGDFESSDKLRGLALSAAQEAGDAALQSIIVATLTNHVATHRAHAYAEGEVAIRKLYAASADTIPTAFSSLQKIGGAAFGLVSGSN